MIAPKRDLNHVSEDIVVGKHRALRNARRAARILQDRDIFRIYFDVGWIRFSDTSEQIHKPDRAFDCDAWSGSRRVFRKRCHDHSLNGRLVARSRDDGSKQVQGKQHTHARILSYYRYFSWCVKGIDVHDDGAKPKDSEGGDHVLRAV